MQSPALILDQDRRPREDRATPSLAIDLTRLLKRQLYRAPTGIDRVEWAYADWLTRRHGGEKPSARFFVRLPGLGFCEARPEAARRFIGKVAAFWRGEIGRMTMGAASARFVAGLRPFRPAKQTGQKQTLFLVVSHLHLMRSAGLARFLDQSGFGLIAFVHDAIPIEFPQFVQQGGADKHRARLATVRNRAAAVIVNSQATKAVLENLWAGPGPRPPVLAAPLGLSLPKKIARPHSLAQSVVQSVAQSVALPGRAAEAPYFLCAGTIEPRKNHRLLLDLWRDFATSEDLNAQWRGSGSPALLFVGRRGWMNAELFAELDDPRARPAGIIERNDVSDQQLWQLMAGARAVLVPSFAEGFSLPVAEALALGVPVIASDLPAHREIGMGVPELLPADDRTQWREAILDFSHSGSTRRDEQIRRIRSWHRPAWEEHFDAFNNFISGL